METVYLVRHPLTAWTGLRYTGRTDVPLTAGGRRQGDAIAAELAARVTGAVGIVSSPLSRARETASRIAEAGGWALVVDPRWREVDFGAAEGATFERVATSWPSVAERLLRGDRAIDWPGGERWRELRSRVTAAWRDLLGEPFDVGIVVSHGGPIAVALERALGTERLAAAANVEPGEVLELTAGDPCHLVRRWRSRP